MPAHRPRKGSLQFWHRKRAAKNLPSANWKPVKGEGLLGLIAYKAGMATAVVKDNTPKTMASGKQIAIPVTILEVPNMKIFSVRFYQFGKVMKEVIVSKDKELKRIVKVPKELKPFEGQIPAEYEDIRVNLYTLPSQAKLKKTPDMVEIAIGGKDKLAFVKTLLGREITVQEIIGKQQIIDVRGVTTGHGLQGPVARFGISLRQHKSEKGVRRPGSLGPWHPARVTYFAPQAGQFGMFTRVSYNQKIVGTGKITEKDINPKEGFKHYGKINTNYLLLKGSVHGPTKRQVLLTTSFRPTKDQTKLQYELIEVNVH